MRICKVKDKLVRLCDAIHAVTSFGVWRITFFVKLQNSTKCFVVCYPGKKRSKCVEYAPIWSTLPYFTIDLYDIMRFTPNPYSATILGQPFCDAVTRKTNQVWQQSTKQSDWRRNRNIKLLHSLIKNIQLM